MGDKHLVITQLAVRRPFGKPLFLQAFPGPTVSIYRKYDNPVFEIDLEHCPNCGGELKIIAAILQAPVIERILTHLGLQARAPPRAPARGQMQRAA